MGSAEAVPLALQPWLDLRNLIKRVEHWNGGGRLELLGNQDRGSFVGACGEH